MQLPISDATVSVQPTPTPPSPPPPPPPPNFAEGLSDFHGVSVAEAAERNASVGVSSNASMTTSNSAVASTSDNAVVLPVDPSAVTASSSSERVAAHSLVALQDVRLNDVTASYATSLPSPAHSPLDLSTSSRALFFRINEDSSNDSGFVLRGSPPVPDDNSAPRSRSSSVGSSSVDGESSASEKNVLSISARRQPIAREAKRPVSYSDDAPPADSNSAKRGRGAGGKRGAGAGGKRGAGAGGKRGAGAGGKRGAGEGGRRGGKSNDSLEEATKRKHGLQDNFASFMNHVNKRHVPRVNFSGVTYSNAQNNRMSSIDPPCFP